MDLTGLLVAGGSAATGNPLGFLTGVGSFLSGIFGGSRPNPDDWKGWDALDSQRNNPAGWQPYHWVIEDGDSVENEASNIFSYIKNKTNGLYNIVSCAKESFNHDFDTAMNNIYTKLNKGGYPDATNAIKAMIAQPSVNTNLGTTQDFFNTNGTLSQQTGTGGLDLATSYISNLLGIKDEENLTTAQSQVVSNVNLVKYSLIGLIFFIIYKIIKK